MSNEDLVKRGEVKAFRQSFIYYSGDDTDGIIISAVTVEDIDSIPQAPHELSAKELLLIEDRMCNEDEDAYNKYISLYWGDRKIDEAIAYVQEWAKDHPERSENNAEI